ncbi:MAG: hypothetical protein U5L01_13380 [Rheinheimera sp.]|nr:hypothetical protein [Rheinheimera sp.]
MNVHFSSKYLFYLPDLWGYLPDSVLNFGCNPSQPSNIATVPLKLVRGGDEVSLEIVANYLPVLAKLLI